MKHKTSNRLFIIFSLASLVIVFSFYYSQKFIINYRLSTSLPNNNEITNNSSLADPFITKVPALADILTGPIISADDPMLGPESAPVTLVQFSDFQCDFCKQQEENLDKIMNLYKNKVRLFWKDYPEEDTASASYQAALAARCAEKQDQFWQYHDLLFTHNQSLNKETFVNLAQSLNLNINTFTKCLETKETEKLIENNIREAQALGINGVPFLYINEQEIMGELSLADLEKIIRLEIDKK